MSVAGVSVVEFGTNRLDFGGVEDQYPDPVTASGTPDLGIFSGFFDNLLD